MFRGRNFLSFLVFALFLSSNYLCEGQKFSYNDEKWWLGHIKFRSGDSLYAKFQYNMETELVSIKRRSADSLINIFPSSQLVSLTFYDPQLKSTRYIYSKSFVDKNNFEKDRLFELIYKNNAQLYYREQNNHTDWFKLKVLLKQQFLFYLSFDNGNTLINFNGKQKEFLAMLPFKKVEMTTFLKTKKLDLHTYDGLISVLMYYDSLVKYP